MLPYKPPRNWGFFENDSEFKLEEKEEEKNVIFITK